MTRLWKQHCVQAARTDVNTLSRKKKKKKREKKNEGPVSIQTIFGLICISLSNVDGYNRKKCLRNLSCPLQTYCRLSTTTEKLRRQDKLF